MTELVTYGNPDINQIIQTFETKMDLKMPRVQKQRWAAKTLIRQHGTAKVLAMIDAVVLARGIEFSPSILSVEDLRDKWNKLVDFYQRQEKAAQKHQIMEI